MTSSCASQEKEAADQLQRWEDRCAVLRHHIGSAKADLTKKAEEAAAYAVEVATEKADVANLLERLSLARDRMITADDLARLREQAEEAAGGLETLREKERSLREAEQEHTRDVGLLDRKAEVSRQRCASRSADIARLRADARHAEESLQRLTEDISTRQRETDRLEGESAALYRNLKSEEGKYEIRQLWRNALSTANDTSANSKAAKERKGAFRHLCRKENLAFLQTRFDKNLALLNGENWDNRLSCELSENYQFTTRDKESVAFNQRSSGEKQRTILGLLFTIAETLMTHGRMRPMLLICDEVG
jgi:chromosome segregation ATPase